MEPKDTGADKGTRMDNARCMMLPPNQAMTEFQLETLRRQICVYSTICSQLVEMHKVISQQASTPREHILYDLAVAGSGFRPSARQRWTPSQPQLQILETLYDRGICTPNKHKLKEITGELSLHGSISETNVYNWFQNRKARAKRKRQLLPQKEGESEADTDGDSSREKKPKTDDEFNKEDAGYGEKNADAPEKSHGIYLRGSGQAEAKLQMHERNHDMSNIGLRHVDKDAQLFEKNYSVVNYKTHANDQQQFDGTRENVSSSLLFFQTEADPHGDTSLERTGNAALVSTENSMSQIDQQGSRVMTVLLDGKQFEVPAGVVDVRRTFGDNAILLDSHGHVVPTNDVGMTFHPLHGSESYTLL